MRFLAAPGYYCQAVGDTTNREVYEGWERGFFGGPESFEQEAMARTC